MKERHTDLYIFVYHGDQRTVLGLTGVCVEDTVYTGTKESIFISHKTIANFDAHEHTNSSIRFSGLYLQEKPNEEFTHQTHYIKKL